MANVITTSSGFFCVLQDQRISAPEEEGGGGRNGVPTYMVETAFLPGDRCEKIEVSRSVAMTS